MKKKSNKKFNWKKFWLGFISLIIILGFTSLVAGSIYIYNIISKAPEITLEMLESKESSQIFDKNGDLISEVGYQIRTNVSYDQLPNSLVDALVSIEDSRFFEHNGFDISRFTKAFIENIKDLSFSQGGSTITMQLIKNSIYLDEIAPKAIPRKVQEIYLALKLESQISKEKIIELYLNKINFGGSGNIRGIQQASQYYFGKDVSELTLSESAMMAGILNAPNAYNPHKNLQKATNRRNTVLDLMYRHGYITKEECDLAKSIKIEDQLVDPSSNVEGNANPYQAYIDVVINEAKQLTGHDPYSVPMKIYTHMDPTVQQTMDDIQAGKVVTFPDEKMEVGAVTIDNDTGAIIAVLGGRNYANGGSLLLNHATDQWNQPGSSVKPFLSYALAFENLGWSTTHTVMDQPIVYAGTNFVVSNFNNRYNGQMLLTDAVGTSMNTPAITTLQEVVNTKGRAYVIDYLQNLGFSRVDSDHFDIGYAIGGSSFQTNAVELANAQATMINYGKYNDPHTISKIEFNDGSEPYIVESNSQQVISEQAAYLATELLYNNVYGPYSNYMQILRRGYGVYAKTGTTNWGEEAVQYGIKNGTAKDKWMISSTTEYTTALWMGYEKADKDYIWTNSKSSKNYPGKISKAILDSLDDISDPSRVQQPSGISSITHIQGVYPYTSPLPNQTEYVVTGKIKSENYSLQNPETTSVETLSDFKAELTSNGNITLNWAVYPDETKLTIAPTELDLSQELGGRWITAVGKRIFDWTWVYGPIRYVADIYVDDQLVHTVVSETNSANYQVEVKPGAKVTVKGYYKFEKMDVKSNEVTVPFAAFENKEYTLNVPSTNYSKPQIENWIKSVGLNTSYLTFETSKTNDSKLVGTNTIIINNEISNNKTIKIKESDLNNLKIKVIIYEAGNGIDNSQIQE